MLNVIIITSSPYCWNVSQLRYSPQVHVCVAMRAPIKVIQLCWIMLSDLIWIRLRSILGLEPPGCPISVRSRPSKLSNLHKRICANRCLSNVNVHGERALVSAMQLCKFCRLHHAWNALQVRCSPKKKKVWEEYQRLVCGRYTFHCTVWNCVLYWCGTATLLSLIGYCAVLDSRAAEAEKSCEFRLQAPAFLWLLI